MAMDVLMINGSGDPVASGDEPIEARLETTLGHTMTYLEDDNAGTAALVAAAASGLDLVVITSSVTTSKVSTDIFDGLAVPVIHCEGTLWDEHNFTDSGAGETSGTQTKITIVAPSHPLAGGLSGDVTVFNTARKVNYLKTSRMPAGATAIAQVFGDTSKVAVWAVETGGLLDDGDAAAERRVGFFTIYDAAAELTADGWTLFDAAVLWAGNEAAAITPSATHTGTATHTGAGSAVDSATEPTMLIEVAWGVDFDTEPTAGQWTDETANVRRQQMVRYGRGRSSDLGRVEPGAMTLAFDNRGRNFEPFYSGDNFPDVRPRAHIRAKQKWHGVEHAAFRGFVTAWTPLYPAGGADSVVVVQCSDITAVTANAAIDGGYISRYVLDSPAAKHWRLSEPAGTDYSIEVVGGTVEGVLLTGVVQNDATFAVDNISKRQYLRKDTAASSLAPAGNFFDQGPMTVAVWLKDNGTTANSYIFESRESDSSSTGFLWQIEAADGGITAAWNNDGAQTPVVVVASSDVLDGDWHYLTLVRDGAGTAWTVQAFLDGVALGAAVTGPVETPSATDPSETDTAGWQFVGWMGELSVLSEALSDTAIFETYQAWLDVFPVESTSDRIATVLGYLDLDASLFNLDAGATSMPSQDLHGVKVVDAIESAAVAELGMFFIDGAGRATFHNRERRTTGLPALAIGQGTAIPVFDVTYRTAEDVLFNVVVADIASGTDSAAAVDAGRRARDGERLLSVDLDVTSTVYAQSYVDHLLATRKDGSLRVDSVTMKPLRDAANMFGPLLAAELGDRVTVNHNPVDDGGATADIVTTGFIERIEWASDGSDYVCTWRISPEALSLTTF